MQAMLPFTVSGMVYSFIDGDVQAAVTQPSQTLSYSSNGGRLLTSYEL